VFTATGPKAALVDPWDTRIDVRYPASDRRVVTKYGRTASGAEAVSLRVIGIRRKESRQPLNGCPLAQRMTPARPTKYAGWQ
jgi:hypothetical protein